MLATARRNHGGLEQAWAAFAAWQERHPDAVTTIPGLTPEQLFFVGYAQAWCTVSSPEFLRLLVRSDVHSPPGFRVNGPLVNHPAFGATFGCAVGTPMNPAQRCEVW